MHPICVLAGTCTPCVVMRTITNPAIWALHGRQSPGNCSGHLAASHGQQRGLEGSGMGHTRCPQINVIRTSFCSQSHVRSVWVSATPVIREKTTSNTAALLLTTRRAQQLPLLGWTRPAILSVPCPARRAQRRSYRRTQRMTQVRPAKSPKNPHTMPMFILGAVAGAGGGG